MRTSRAIFLNAASIAFSNSASSTSTESLTLLPSRGSTVAFTEGWFSGRGFHRAASVPAGFVRPCMSARPAHHDQPEGEWSATCGPSGRARMAGQRRPISPRSRAAMARPATSQHDGMAVGQYPPQHFTPHRRDHGVRERSGDQLDSGWTRNRERRSFPRPGSRRADRLRAQQRDGRRGQTAADRRESDRRSLSHETKLTRVPTARHTCNCHSAIQPMRVIVSAVGERGSHAYDERHPPSGGRRTIF